MEMRAIMRTTTLLLAVSTLLGGCSILGPEDPDRVIVTGTVYVDHEPAGRLQVSLSHLVPGCPLFCDLVSETVSDATTGAGGTYRLEAADPGGNGGVSFCDTEFFVRVVGHLFALESVRGCQTHSGVDFYRFSS